MVTYGFVRPALMITIGLLLMVAVGLAGTMEGKVPITTTSNQALDQFLKGRDLAERLRVQDARPYFEKAIALDPNFALAHLNLAFVAPSAKLFFEHHDIAKGLIDKVSEGEKLMILGVEAGNNAQPMKQREIYQKLVTMFPDDERVHNLLGTNYFGQQQWEQAVEHYKKSTEINSSFSPPYNQMGYAYRFLEKYPEAETSFQKYIELIPDDPNPYDSYAELLMKMGRYQESIDNYKKALAVSPTFAASHIGIATNLNFMGKYPEARTQLQELYNNARDDGQRRQAHFAMAVSYADEGNTEMAINEIKNQYIIAEQIGDYAAMSGDAITMGNIYYSAGQYDDAMKMYQKSVSLIEKANLTEEVKDNTRRNFLFNEARIALMKGDLQTAKVKTDEYKMKVETLNNPFQIRLAHELKGMIALEEKDFKTAHTNLLKANQQNPQNLCRLAEVYMAEGDQQEAKAMCQKAVNFNQLNSLNQAFAKHKAKRMLAGM
ncbi:MAG: tetratricopeptide repeat protein [Candidatus Zixiibacteriota bacterium]|nr:MAG: tetratricopeptide repeat protein [candidate division Zixibacteria bacterium]